MNRRDIVVIGASGGGLTALLELVRELPRDFPAAVFIVQHVTGPTTGALPPLLQESSQLEVTYARHNQEIRKSHIYVAPPDYHLIVEKGHLRLSQGPSENLARPAIDPLFRSSALAFSSRVVGVVLTGELDDGTAGLWSIKQRGGITVVQDPHEAQYPGMPKSAVKHVQIDHCVPLLEIAPLLVRLVNEPIATLEDNSGDETLELENRIALNELEVFGGIEKLGRLTDFTCPDCHGSLLEIGDGSLLRFRCRSGHAYTAESLIAEQWQVVENLLHDAIRESGENPTLCRYLSEHARAHGDHLMADHFLYQTAENERRAHLIHQLVHDHERTMVFTQPLAAKGRRRLIFEP